MRDAPVHALSTETDTGQRPAPADPAQSADREWVAEQFDRHHQKLVNYAAGLLGGSRDSAIDAVQETFLRLCKQSRSQIESYVEPWLYRTCRNHIFDQLRQKQRMSPTQQAEIVADQRTDSDPTRRLAHDDELQRCCHVIEKLPAKQRELLDLRLTHGLSYKQIAEVTGMTVTNVGVTLHQTIHKLRAQLAS